MSSASINACICAGVIAEPLKPEPAARCKGADGTAPDDDALMRTARITGTDFTATRLLERIEGPATGKSLLDEEVDEAALILFTWAVRPGTPAAPIITPMPGALPAAPLPAAPLPAAPLPVALLPVALLPSAPLLAAPLAAPSFAFSSFGS